MPSRQHNNNNSNDNNDNNSCNKHEQKWTCKILEQHLITRHRSVFFVYFFDNFMFFWVFFSIFLLLFIVLPLICLAFSIVTNNGHIDL